MKKQITELTLRQFSIGEVASLTGVPRTSIIEWARSGLVALTTSQPAGKKRRSCRQRLNAVGILAVGIIDSFRRRGATRTMTRPIVECLATMTPRELVDAIADGRCYLIAAGDLIPPRLATRDEVVANRSGWNEIISCVDLAEAWSRIEHGVRQHDAKTPLLN